MTIKELFIASNETEQKVVEQIADDQWELMMPEMIAGSIGRSVSSPLRSKLQAMPVPKQSYWRWLEESKKRSWRKLAP